MENGLQLANRFKEIILDGKWIANTNYKETLRGLTWEQANTKIASLNTIAALTFHVNYYIAGVLNVFEGGELEIRDKYSFNCPTIDSQMVWDELVNELLSNSSKFAEHIKLFSPEQLYQYFVNEKYGSYRRNIEGMIEHCYYHLGQISLLKKMILTKT